MQITRSTPCLRIILQFSQIRLTEALTFMIFLVTLVPARTLAIAARYARIAARYARHRGTINALCR